MARVIVFRGGRDAARALVRELAGDLAGERLAAVVGNALLGQIAEDFDTKSRGGVGRDGIRWPPLRPATLARKRAKGQPDDILVATRAMRESLEPGEGDRPSGAPGQVFEVTDEGVEVGTTEKPWHQRPGKRRPARRLWPEGGTVPGAWWDGVLEAAAGHAEEALAEGLAKG